MDTSNDIFSEKQVQDEQQIIKKPGPLTIELDKNELPFDIQHSIKMAVMESLLAEQWNRYPKANNLEIETLIANRIAMQPENIVAGSGAATIIVSLLSYFSLSHKHIIIVQPAYALFDYYCNTYNIPYDPWLLNANLEFDVALLPEVKENSVIFLSTPNNPVGNVIKQKDLEGLLKKFPKTIFVVDEVYHEFAGTDFKNLIDQYSNVIILRSFSKTMSAAGIRLGYMIGTKAIAENIRKLIISYSLNHLTWAFAKTVLTNDTIWDFFKTNVNTIINERDKLFSALSNLDYIQIKRSYGNFLLITFKKPAHHALMIEMLHSKGIKVLDVSNMSLLENSIRVAVGNPNENEILMEIFNNFGANLK